jgi:glutamyl-tRNA synthetase
MVRTRLAPSPTGDPHIGTLFQALFNYVYAKKHQGKFIVRIEDTDKKREQEDSQQLIFESLSWLGLTPDESLLNPGKYGPYLQSKRLDIYQQHAKKLIDSGHAYYCFCNQERIDQVRKEMQAQGKPPMYDKHCRNLDPKKLEARAKLEPHVIRLKVPKNQTIIVLDLLRGQIKFDSNTIDDQVILKTDGYPTYHLAVVVDDHLMKITHMIRGEEWLSSAPKHVLLYQAFNWEPPQFIHTPLLRNKDRSKLSKRQNHSSVKWYQDQGYLKEAVINFLATRAWNHPQGKEIFGLQELIKYFDFKDMHIQGPVADLDKLNWLNGQWIRSLPQKEIYPSLKLFLPKDLSPALFKKIWPQINQRIETLSELPFLTEYFIKEPKLDTKEILKESKVDLETTKDYLLQVIKVLEPLKTWTVVSLETTLKEFQLQSDFKPRPAFMTIRLVVTGRAQTPPLFDVLEILGKKTVISRLLHAQKNL